MTATGQKALSQLIQASDSDIEAMILGRKKVGLLESYFGESHYQELYELARESNARSVHQGQKVLILPGIMGSKLAVKTKDDYNTIWLDPFDIAAGKMLRLAVARRNVIKPSGVILLYYLRLKWRLRAKGYQAEFYPYDWRLPIRNLGYQLYKDIKSGAFGDRISLVCHSSRSIFRRRTSLSS